jgi:trimethylamine:corrinoid methyltransferase-like protein
VYGSAPGVPTDVPLALRPIEQFMIAAEHSPAGGFTSQVTDLRTAEVIREMNSVYGRRRRSSIQPISPLVFGGTELEIVWRFRNEMDFVNIGSMPLMGFTAPCDMVAVFTQAIAESIGGAAILHELVPDLPVSITPHPEPVDMRSGNIVFGTPEWTLLELMHRDVLEFYGIPRDFHLLHTTSPVPDAQAMIDRTSSATAAMLSGFRHFNAAGHLSLDEVFSPAMLLLDLEMLEHVERFARGAEPADGLDLDGLPEVIAEVVNSDRLFAEHETTLVNLRRQYHAPRLLRQRARSQWEAAGRPEALREAQAEADRLVARFEYEPPRDILKELRAIHGRAKDNLS